MSLQPSTPAPRSLDALLTSVNRERADKPVFLLFFRSDCPWCASEVPHLAGVFESSGNKLDHHVIGVACGRDTAEIARSFAAEKGWNFPLATDLDGVLRRDFAISRVPAIVAINAHGLIERVYEGVTEQLGGILAQTILATARGITPPEYSMIGNGCSP